MNKETKEQARNPLELEMTYMRERERKREEENYIVAVFHVVGFTLYSTLGYATSIHSSDNLSTHTNDTRLDKAGLPEGVGGGKEGILT